MIGNDHKLCFESSESNYKAIKYWCWRRPLSHLTALPIFTNEEIETQKDEMISPKSQS